MSGGYDAFNMREERLEGLGWLLDEGVELSHRFNSNGCGVRSRLTMSNGDKALLDSTSMLQLQNDFLSLEKVEAAKVFELRDLSPG